MKNFVKTVLIVGFMFIASNAVAQKTTQKVLIKTNISCDHCKQYETCGGLLEKKLLKTTGVQMITLNEKDETIEVIYNSKKTDLQTIKIAISKLGYDADEVKADPTGYEKLDGCCKA